MVRSRRMRPYNHILKIVWLWSAGLGHFTPGVQQCGKQCFRNLCNTICRIQCFLTVAIPCRFCVCNTFSESYKCCWFPETCIFSFSCIFCFDCRNYSVPRVCPRESICKSRDTRLLSYWNRLNPDKQPASILCTLPSQPFYHRTLPLCRQKLPQLSCWICSHAKACELTTKPLYWQC